jgi:hypothetical protein
MSNPNGPGPKGLERASEAIADVLNEMYPDWHFSALKPGQRLPKGAGLVTSFARGSETLATEDRKPTHN